jgi:hypothetical protein
MVHLLLLVSAKPYSPADLLARNDAGTFGASEAEKPRKPRKPMKSWKSWKKPEAMKAKETKDAKEVLQCFLGRGEFEAP